MTAIDPTLRATKTTCPYCGVGCGVLATPDGAGGAAIAGDPDHPANFGRLCSKGSALGECAEHRGTCYGLVEPAYEQARVLARHLGGKPASYPGSVVSTNLKVSGVSVFSAGDFMGGEGSESLVLSDRRRGTYKKLVIADGCLTGAVLIGDTADALWYLELIRTREKITAFRTDMMFGRTLALPPKAA